MIKKIISTSLENRFFVILIYSIIVMLGLFTIKRINIDAIPDLSDVQVIVYTSYPGQSPQVVEDQITYPLSSSLLSVPGSKVIRSYSFFGLSLIYVLFEEGTDLYFARSRVLEYLNYANQFLPKDVRPQIGPPATGVGWVYMYALVDTSGKYDLQQLRTLQDWFLRYEFASIDGVAEVASGGGFVKQYFVEPYPEKMILNNLDIEDLRMAIEKNNRDVGGDVIQSGESEYMVISKGYIRNENDLKNISVKTNPEAGNSIKIGDIANVYNGPASRRGVIEWNGIGEAVTGIIIAGYGENTLQVIDKVKKKLDEIKPLLPEGIEIIPAYDRSKLIYRAIRNISQKLIEEMIVVGIVIFIFLLHFRSSFVAFIALPVGVLTSLMIMYFLNIQANIMSLGGIAIAIGVMVDASVVLVENLHKHLEKDQNLNFLDLVQKSSYEVGPSLFYSLVIITLSFLPILLLTGESGKLFKPLAFTKTFAMASASIIAITLIPVLMFYFVKGNIKNENENPISKISMKIYEPFLIYCLNHKEKTILFSIVFVIITLIPIFGIPHPMKEEYLIRPIGGEFMPPLEEGDILYMPTTQPAISIEKAREILQITDQLIKEVPEVETVLGKIGRIESATDPAPLNMIETTIQLKPKAEWRNGVTIETIIQELNEKVNIPGLVNSWTYPIRTRIDMLSTGFKTPLGIKILGNDYHQLMEISLKIESILNSLPETQSAYAEKITGGRYIYIHIRRNELVRHGLSVQDVQNHIDMLLGGMVVSTTVEGIERYPIVIRYPRELRDTIEKIENLWISIPGEKKKYIPLSQIADISVQDGVMEFRSENARRSVYIYIELKEGFDMSNFVAKAQKLIHQSIANGEIKIPIGTSIIWSGQYEKLEASRKQIFYSAILTIIVIFFLLFFHFRNFYEIFIVFSTLFFALTGGIWLIYFLGYNRSIATDTGFIALSGLGIETSIVMIVYLKNSLQSFLNQMEGRLTSAQIREAILHGSLLRLRPKLMTVITTILGLIPILWSTEEGSTIMKSLAIPMIGGLFTSTILTLIIIPVVYEYLSIHSKKFLNAIQK